MAIVCVMAAVTSPSARADVPTMGLDQLRRGMTGYGMSVFTDDKIEPFPIEIVSVVTDDKPGVNSIWIRCPGDRMQLTGPVQGMSGSPIYVWPDDVAESDRIPGQNGKLIGAFAFGYGLGKDCYVGVQPIGQMRAVAQRLNQQLEEQGPSAMGDAWPHDPSHSGNPRHPSNQGDGQVTLKLLQALKQSTAHTSSYGRSAWKMDALERLIKPSHIATRVQTNHADHTNHALASRTVPTELPYYSNRHSRQVQPMLLPMTGMSASVTTTMQPMFEALGLSAIATGQATGGSGSSGQLSRAPNGIDVDALQLAPGSILAIPLAWGDVNFTAAGTVTDVLDDGTVLAFGHGMGDNGLGEGPIALPVATGYVHFIQPHLQSSFKMSGAGKIVGTLMRDENSAVIARDQQVFTTADAKVTVRLPGQPKRSYQAQLVQNRNYTAMLGAAMTLESIEAIQGIPPLSTLRVRYEMTFADSPHHGNDGVRDGTSATASERKPRVLEVDTLLPGATGYDLAYEILPPISVMIDNPYESAMLESLNVTVDVEPVVKTLSMQNVRLDKIEYEPGETIAARITMMPYGQREITTQVALTIPDDLPDGDYSIMVCDAPTYAQLALLSRPHLMQIHNADELLDLVQQFFGVDNTAVYMLMMLPEQGLAVGRTELPRLPSSRRALIASPTTSAVTAYSDWVTSVTQVDGVPSGQFALNITVRRNPH